MKCRPEDVTPLSTPLKRMSQGPVDEPSLSVLPDWPHQVQFPCWLQAPTHTHGESESKLVREGLPGNTVQAVTQPKGTLGLEAQGLELAAAASGPRCWKQRLTGQDCAWRLEGTVWFGKGQHIVLAVDTKAALSPFLSDPLNRWPGQGTTAFFTAPGRQAARGVK